MMGRGKLEQTVFIIDYGFVKRYKDPATGKHIPFKTKKKNNPGTPLYTSLDTDSRNGNKVSLREIIKIFPSIFLFFVDYS